MYVWALQTRTFEGSGASNTTKFAREDTQRERQKEGKWEESAKFWAPTLRGPALRGPIFSGFGPHPSGPDFFWVWAPPFGPHHDTHTPRSKWIGQKCIGQNLIGQNGPGQNQVGPKWIGQNWSNQDGQNGIGQSRSLPSPPPSLQTQTHRRHPRLCRLLDECRQSGLSIDKTLLFEL